MRLAVIPILFMLLFFPATTGMAQGVTANLSYDVGVNVNGDPVTFPDQKPFIDTGTGRTYVPLRFVTEKLGVNVDWNQQAKIAIIEKNGKTIKAPVGSSQPTVNGDPVYLDAPVKLLNSRTVVPLRFMSETLGTTVEWDSDTRTVYIRTNIQPGEPINKEEEKGEIDWENIDSTVASLELRENEHRTVATVTTTGPVEHNIFTLTGPDRVVVDLKGVKPGDLPAKIDVDNDLVSKVRTGKFSENPNIVRLVFDVKEPAMFSVSQRKMDGGSRLTLELYVPDLGKHLKGRIIAIDPGHGGHDPGAIGPTGLKEKDVNIDVSLLTAQLLRQNGAKVVLTRTADTYVDLYERTEIAARAGADVFVSMHVNANPKESISGTSTFYRRDNISGLGVSQEDNRLLARQVHDQLLQTLGRRNAGIHQANFVVLRTATMPAVLVEASFISNSEEERLLRKESYRAKIAEAVAKGIADYFAQKVS